MLEESQLDQSEISAGMSDTTTSTSSRKMPRKTVWILIGGLFTVVCVCSILCVALGATGFGRAMVEKAPITKVLESFMVDMEKKDVDNAYTLFSPRVQSQMDVSEIAEMLIGNNYALFEGYQSISIQIFNVGTYVNTNPNLPQGLVARVAGTILYEGGFTGNFEAVLEKVDNEWRLHNINITVPPDKFSQ